MIMQRINTEHKNVWHANISYTVRTDLGGSHVCCFVDWNPLSSKILTVIFSSSIWCTKVWIYSVFHVFMYLLRSCGPVHI
jgi:hypothetical protein